AGCARCRGIVAEGADVDRRLAAIVFPIATGLTAAALLRDDAAAMAVTASAPVPDAIFEPPVHGIELTAASAFGPAPGGEGAGGAAGGSSGAAASGVATPIVAGIVAASLLLVAGGITAGVIAAQPTAPETPPVVAEPVEPDVDEPEAPQEPEPEEVPESVERIEPPVSE